MDVCHELHHLLNDQRRHCFPFEENLIPKNGIYFLYEKGEYGHGTDRIVRVGTHTGESQLRSRLKQHFLKENKDWSIFRKNIGRAYLNAKKDPFLEQWEYDLTSRKNREKYLDLVDLKKLQEVEAIVSGYIRDHFSFVVVEVANREIRLRYESRLISTVSLCKACSGSNSWLGLNSPKNKIRESGLWLVNELYKTPFSVEEYEEFKDLVEIMPDISTIKKKFDQSFLAFGIELPCEDLANRHRGEISEQGWHIQYLFGSDDRGEYMDYYSMHRMTNDGHTRLYADGHSESLPAFLDFRRCSEDPVEDTKFEAEFKKANHHVAKLLEAKGFS